MIVAVDLDGTLCSWQPGLYEDAQPFAECIARVQRIKAEGNDIWIYTARGASLGSEALAEKRWGEITRRQLTEWGVPYDRLIFNKPSFDVLIDDRAVKFTADWEKQIAENAQKVALRTARSSENHGA